VSYKQLCEETKINWTKFSAISHWKAGAAGPSVAKDRAMANEALQEVSLWLDQLCAKAGRPSIPPEQLLRAQILRVLYTIRSERQLMDQIDGNWCYRWFVGLKVDDPV